MIIFTFIRSKSTRMNIRIIPRLTLAFLISLMLTACATQDKQHETLASKIQYDVPIVSNDPQLDWWINNIEGSRREPFLQRIMEAAEKGEVRVYDYFNKPLSPQQVRAMGSDTVYMTLMREYPPYEEYDTMVVHTVSWREITKIRFLEEWTWITGSLEIKKRLIGLGPVIQREMAGEQYNQLLFWIYPGPDSPQP